MEGDRKGVSENIQSTIPDQFYVALKHLLTVYAKVITLSVLENVGNTYATMDNFSNKKLKAKYYRALNVA